MVCWFFIIMLHTLVASKMLLRGCWDIDGGGDGEVEFVDALVDVCLLKLRKARNIGYEGGKSKEI